MKREEVMAIISSMEMQLAALKELVAAEEVVNENHQEETTDETPVVNEVSNVPIIEEEVEELPAPPAVVYVDMPKDNKDEQPDEDAILGCKIITSLPDFYNGKCSVLKIHKRYFDNGQPKLFIDIYHVVIEACDANMVVIGSMVTHWNNLSKFHADLLKRGINTHAKGNWMPKTILLDLD